MHFVPFIVGAAVGVVATCFLEEGSSTKNMIKNTCNKVTGLFKKGEDEAVEAKEKLEEVADKVKES